MENVNVIIRVYRVYSWIILSLYFKNLFIVPFVFFLWSLDGAYASNSQSDPDFRQAVGPTAHHYPGLVTTKNVLFDINVSVDLSTIYFAPRVPSLCHAVVNLVNLLFG